MRRVQDYLYAAHEALGASYQSEDTVDVIHHPDSRLGSLNYMTPGRNIGWLQGSTIGLGLDRMRQQSRRGRMRVIEALFPPFFSKIMNSAGLQLEWQAPLLIYLRDGLHDQPGLAVEMPPLPEDMVISRVTNTKSADAWRIIWQDTAFQVTASPVEALNLAADNACQHDLLVYRAGSLVAAVRIGVQDDSAHIIAQALLGHESAEDMGQILDAAALDLALDKGCSLVFSVGGSPADIERRKTMGFLDFDSMMCYAANPSGASEDANDDDMGQPLFAVR
jgi:hypothetical protein